MGGKVDPLYRTPLEGRGFLDIQSNDLHGGRGLLRGRTTNQVQYTTPKMGGFSLVVNTTLSGAGDGTVNGNTTDEKTGVGLRWSNKSFLVYADWIDQLAVTPNPNATGTPSTESAVKIGGKFSAKAFSIGLQYEAAKDVTARDYIFASGVFNINKNNGIILTAGMADVDELSGTTQSFDSTGVALAYNHKMSKMTNVYVGYGAYSNDASIANGGPGDNSMVTLGIKKKF
jgi:predicted porin